MNKRKHINLIALVAAIALLVPAFAWAWPAEVPRTGQTTCYHIGLWVFDRELSRVALGSFRDRDIL